MDGVGPERYAAEYRKAEEALRRERQEVLDVTDVVQASLVLVKSPENRVRIHFIWVLKIEVHNVACELLRKSLFAPFPQLSARDGRGAR